MGLPPELTDFIFAVSDATPVELFEQLQNWTRPSANESRDIGMDIRKLSKFWFPLV